MRRGRFITFEGGEGCGKSTQVALLEKALRSEGVETITTREPGGTWVSEKIRYLIKDQTSEVPCARTELLLFLAARAQLVEKVIAPALDSGVWVVSDRFSDSTFAYQGYGRGLDLDTLRSANDFACRGLKPDLTILLDVDAGISESRRCQREEKTHTSSDRIESESLEFHRRLMNGFAELARQEPTRITAIDARGGVEEVQRKVWNLVKPMI